MRVHYTAEGGMIQIREVPTGTNPKAYQFGILVGPPDLSDLPLPTKQIKELSNKLALHDMGNYADTQGRRSELLGIIKEVIGARDKEMMRLILSIYQRELFEE